MGIDPLDLLNVGVSGVPVALGLADRYTLRHDPLLYGGMESQIAMYNDFVNQGAYRQPEYDYMRQMLQMDPTAATVQNYQQLAQMQRPGMADSTAGLAGLLGGEGAFQGGYQSPMFSPQHQAAPSVTNFGQPYSPPAGSQVTESPYGGMGDTVDQMLDGWGLGQMPSGGGIGGSNSPLGTLDRMLFPNQGQYAGLTGPMGRQAYNVTHPFGGVFSQGGGGNSPFTGGGLQDTIYNITHPVQTLTGGGLQDTIYNITHPVQTLTGGNYGFAGNGSQSAGTKQMQQPQQDMGRYAMQQPYSEAEGDAGFFNRPGPNDPAVFSPEQGGWVPAPTQGVSPPPMTGGQQQPMVKTPQQGGGGNSPFTGGGLQDTIYNITHPVQTLTGGNYGFAGNGSQSAGTKQMQQPQQGGGAGGQQPTAFQDYVNNPLANVNQARSNLQTGAYNTAVTNPTGQVDQARNQLNAGAYGGYMRNPTADVSTARHNLNQGVYGGYMRNPTADVSTARHNLNQGVYGDLLQSPTSFSDQVVKDLLRTGETSINQQSMGTQRQMLDQAGAGTAGGGAMERRLFDLEMNRQNQMSQMGRDVRTQQALQNFQDMMGVAGMQAGVEQGLAGMGLQARQGAAGLQSSTEQGLAGMGLQARQGAAGLQSSMEQGLAGLGTDAIMQGAGLQSGTEQGLAQLGQAGQQGAANLQFGAQQAMANQIAAENAQRQGMYNTDFQNQGRMISDMRGLGMEEMQRRLGLLNQMGGLGEQGMMLQNWLLQNLMTNEARRIVPTGAGQMPADYGSYGIGGGGSGGGDMSGVYQGLADLGGMMYGSTNPW